MSCVSAVVIGRNEGARLVACLASLGKGFERVVYVDSGSTDESVKAAKAVGAEVVELDMTQPFTAARARNAGIAALGVGELPEFVQFIDGDCTLNPDWLTTAITFIADRPNVAVVCGRTRERFPEATIYNRLCDFEWNTPIGETTACGGIALIRWKALREVEGFNPRLIAGEEPELCLRMRREGWKIWRLEADMCLHDAAMTRFDQFWVRAKRSGHAYAEASAMHGGGPERHGVLGTVRGLAWGLGVPLLVLLGVIMVGPAALWLLLVYPLQTTRMALRNGGSKVAWERAILLTIGKFAEAQGVVGYYWRRRRGETTNLIEYK